MQLKSLLRPTVFPFLGVRVRTSTLSRRGADIGVKATLHHRAMTNGKARRVAV
jgi:hypothetical protein